MASQLNARGRGKEHQMSNEWQPAEDMPRGSRLNVAIPEGRTVEIQNPGGASPPLGTTASTHREILGGGDA